MPPTSAEPDLTRLRAIFITQRENNRQSFDELARESGLARQTLLNLSAGRFHGDLRTWLILSRTWGIPLDDLLAPVWDEN